MLFRVNSGFCHWDDWEKIWIHPYYNNDNIQWQHYISWKWIEIVCLDSLIEMNLKLPTCISNKMSFFSLHLSQYFEYTSHKEIRFNSVTELCAEVQDGTTHIGMKHCPQDGAPTPPNIMWEFRDVSLFACSSVYHRSAIRKQKEIRKKLACLACYCISDMLSCCLSMLKTVIICQLCLFRMAAYIIHIQTCVSRPTAHKMAVLISRWQVALPETNTSAGNLSDFKPHVNLNVSAIIKRNVFSGLALNKGAKNRHKNGTHSP